ncbi:N6-adenine-specific methylase [Candidatus Moduliflexus flocculans]|uniref:N6-adenine-specific methylase n=1 Tax=Candidatus Moduliflexus flocculans TaxID=1499966 RepID=A0A0S6VTU7_9BACT|nr:N6-adenine-specific methylase [Candidatus Moduliflexus flocculans]
MIGGDIRGATCLDLFAGTGNVGIEALSRQAAHVVFIEKAPAHFRVLQENLTACGLNSNATVFCGDANILLKKLQKAGMTFDLIYLDPPYRQTNMLRDVLERIAEMGLLAPDGQVIVEHASAHEMPSAILDALELSKTRRVGDTTLSFYCWHNLPEGTSL